MAEANLWQRLSNLWKGFVSLWISDVEKEHPEIAYENAINSVVDKYARLKRATAAIIRRREDTGHRLKRETDALAQIRADLNAALDTEQDDLALVLLQKKGSVEAAIGSLRRELEGARGDADDAKASLMAVKAELAELKAEKDRMLAKMKSAQARIQVQETVEGLSVDAEVQALDNVREHIRNTIAEANLGRELGDSDLDRRLHKLRQNSGRATARAQLAELKKARGTAAARSL